MNSAKVSPRNTYRDFAKKSKLTQYNIRNEFIFLKAEKTLVMIFISLEQLYTDSILEKRVSKFLK